MSLNRIRIKEFNSRFKATEAFYKVLDKARKDLINTLHSEVYNMLENGPTFKLAPADVSMLVDMLMDRCPPVSFRQTGCGNISCRECWEYSLRDYI